MRLRRCSMGCLAALLLAAALVWDPFHVVLALRWGNERFDSQRWKDAAHGKQVAYPNPRGRMAASLLRTHKLVRLSRDEVANLLGPPDSRGPWARPTAVAGAADEWNYYLGMYSGFGIDEDILIIEFSPEGFVVRYGLVNG